MQKPYSSLRLPIIFAVVAGFVFAGCAGDVNEDAAQSEPVTAKLANSQGDSLGQVEFVDVDGGLEVTIAAKNLDAGFYGVHIHEVGQCQPASQAPDDPEETGNFLSAGGHIVGEDAAEHPDHAGDHPHHAGDLPTLLVNQDGTAEMSVVTDRLGMPLLSDFDGSAVVIHAEPDNFANVPDRYLGDESSPDDDTLAAGDASDRIGCGVVEGVVED